MMRTGQSRANPPSVHASSSCPRRLSPFLHCLYLLRRSPLRVASRSAWSAASLAPGLRAWLQVTPQWGVRPFLSSYRPIRSWAVLLLTLLLAWPLLREGCPCPCPGPFRGPVALHLLRLYPELELLPEMASVRAWSPYVSRPREVSFCLLFQRGRLPRPRELPRLAEQGPLPCHPEREWEWRPRRSFYPQEIRARAETWQHKLPPISARVHGGLILNRLHRLRS